MDVLSWPYEALLAVFLQFVDLVRSQMPSAANALTHQMVYSFPQSIYLIRTPQIKKEIICCLEILFTIEPKYLYIHI